jgi:hypothetical protein
MGATNNDVDLRMVPDALLMFPDLVWLRPQGG